MACLSETIFMYLFTCLFIYWNLYSWFIYRCSQLLRLHSEIRQINNEFENAVEGRDRRPI